METKTKSYVRPGFSRPGDIDQGRMWVAHGTIPSLDEEERQLVASVDGKSGVLALAILGQQWCPPFLDPIDICEVVLLSGDSERVRLALRTHGVPDEFIERYKRHGGMGELTESYAPRSLDSVPLWPEPVQHFVVVKRNFADASLFTATCSCGWEGEAGSDAELAAEDGRGHELVVTPWEPPAGTTASVVRLPCKEPESVEDAPETWQARFHRNLIDAEGDDPSPEALRWKAEIIATKQKERREAGEPELSDEEFWEMHRRFAWLYLRGRPGIVGSL